MKICPTCHSQLSDDAQFCTNCGTRMGGAQAAPVNQMPQDRPYSPYAVPVAYDPYDHTAEFDAQDISDNKVYCMLVYLMGIVGIVIALLACKDSKYAAFHVRQAIKFTVVSTLSAIVMCVLAFTVIVPIVGAVWLVVLEVLQIICFFQICGGKAKEPAIIRNLTFLK